jgi:hypothetical protein
MEDAVAHGQRTIFGRLGPPPLPAFVLHTGDLFVGVLLIVAVVGVVRVEKGRW